MLVRPLRAADADALFVAGGDPAIWTYLPYGPFEDVAPLRDLLAEFERSDDPLFFTIERGGEAAGVASYLRIHPEHGTIEIGHIWFGTELQRTVAASEAIYLLARNAFDLGYRRLEWKCDALNARSRRAAERFGFRFEGIFLKHQVNKGRNRDTAWYAIVDDEWPRVRRSFEAWLSAENFDEAGRQRARLEDLR